MEQFSGLLLNSIGIGGAVFAAFILVWFVAVYLKRRTSHQTGEAMPGALIRPQNPSAEKRREPRLSTSWPASVATPQGEQAAQIKDISLGGAFVACAAPPALNERLTITLHPPQGMVLQMHAAVVWSNANVPADKVVHRGMGIRFTENEPSKRKQLTEAISHCLADPSPPAAKGSGTGGER